MIRRAVLTILLVLVPVVMLAQQGEAGHGAAKSNHEAASSEAHASEHEAPKTYFGIPGWILKLINMIAFFAVLTYLIGGPIKSAFVARSGAIRAAADEARTRRAKADSLAGDIQARLTQIEQEVRAIHDRALSEGERQKKELIAAAESEAAKIVQNARTEIDNRLKLARHELTAYAGQLATERAEAILSAQITPADQQKLFRDSVLEVGEARS